MGGDGGGCGSGGGGKGKGKGGKEDSREVRISKALTQILRHKAVDYGLHVELDGYVCVDEVLSCKVISKFAATIEDLEKITRESDKQRFELKHGPEVAGGHAYIRAVQGHSMKVVQDEKLMRTLAVDDPDLPSECVHGTYKRHLRDILLDGLKAGGKLGPTFRNHVHFAPHAPGDERVISGMRYDCEIAIWVDLREALRKHIPFFMARNQVITTPGINGVVPKDLIQKVLDLRSGAQLFPEVHALDVAQRVWVPASCSSASLAATEDPTAPATWQEAKAPPNGDGAGCGAAAAAAAAAAGAAAGGATAETAASSAAAPLPARVRRWVSGAGATSASASASASASSVGGDASSAGKSTYYPPAGARSVPRETHSEVVRIPVEASIGCPNTELLARLNWNGGTSLIGPFQCAVVYLHGLLDPSLDHRGGPGDDTFGAFSARFPQQLSSLLLSQVEGALLVAFNFAGSPGSDEVRGFSAKTVSREVVDAKAVLRYLRDEGRLPPEAQAHVVGFSTGAVVASLLRGCDCNMTVTAVGGLLDPLQGLECHFNQEQLQSFEKQGFCELQLAASSKPLMEEGAEADAEACLRCKLGVAYRDDFQKHDIGAAVRSEGGRFLVVHGSEDEVVPEEHGRALHEAAAEPKDLVIIAGANHTLQSTHFLRRALLRIMEMVKQGLR